MEYKELIPITIGKLKAEPPKDWDYDKSIKKWGDIKRVLRKGMVKALQELRFAHQLLTEDSKKKKGRKWPSKTFETYCNDLGMDKKTAYKYLHIHFPNYMPLRIVENSTIPHEVRERVSSGNATKDDWKLLYKLDTTMRFRDMEEYKRDTFENFLKDFFNITPKMYHEERLKAFGGETKETVEEIKLTAETIPPEAKLEPINTDLTLKKPGQIGILKPAQDITLKPLNLTPQKPIWESPHKPKQEYKHTEMHEVSDAMSFATIAISQLDRIRDDDPKREEALTKVEQWIQKNRRVEKPSGKANNRENFPI